MVSFSETNSFDSGRGDADEELRYLYQTQVNNKWAAESIVRV